MTVYVTFVFSFDVSAHFDFRLQQLWTASTYTSRSVILRNRPPRSSNLPEKVRSAQNRTI